MYLTRMELDLNKRKTLMAMASPALFHGAIESSFPQKGGRLWRRDMLGEKQYLLLVSEEQPELTAAVKQFGTAYGWKTLDYTPFLQKIRQGDCRQFRLKANPIITKSAGSGSRGSVLAHVTVEQQAQWLLARAERYGFQLNREDFDIVQNSWESFQKGSDGGRRVSFRAVTYEGKLIVSDAEVFRQTLQKGVGREKAYGCGLMTVTRCL